MTGAKGIRILIIDDHWMFRQSLKRVLEKSGIEVVGEAENGHVAVQKAKELRPDVILIDINMPILGGIGATRQIKKLTPDAIVIALSNHSDGYSIQEIIEAGATDYIPKSVSSSELERSIRRAVARRSIHPGQPG